MSSTLHQNWEQLTLGDLGRVVTGRTPPSSKPELFGDQYPFITPTDMAFSDRSIRSERGISDAGAESLSRIKLPAKTPCFVCIGATIGKLCLTSEESFTNQQINSIVVNKDRHNPDFVYYLLRHVSGQVKSLAGGAATPIINKSAFSEVPVLVPSLEVQESIASILSAYDDLIENNTRRIEILEEMARRLYEEWFVHFRFPGHEEVSFKESELGEIPEGWEVRRLEDTVALNPRTKVPKEGEKLFVPMGALSESSMIVGSLERKPGNSGAKFQNGDTLFARITPCLENGKTGFVDFLPEDQPTACGSTEFIVLRSVSLCPEMVYLLARSDRFRDVAIKSMSGATGRQRVRLESLVEFPVVQPDNATLEAFQRFVSPCFKQARTLALKNSNLRAQRDLLLPKLVSGEIDVSDIPMPEDKEIEAA